MILYSQLLQDAVADLARTSELLDHVDPSRILAVAAPRAAGSKWGGLAECVALGLDESPTVEFTYDPARRKVTAATPWFIPRNRRVLIGRRRMLYLLRFRLPRFLDSHPTESLVHELLHIGEKFDGTHRALRHGVWFDRYVRQICREWRRRGDPDLVGLMSLDFAALRRRFGAVAARCPRQPFRTPLRLRAPAPGDLASHPEIQRLDLEIDALALRRIPMVFDDPSRINLTEKDFEYRVFHPRGSHPIAPELVETAYRAHSRIAPENTP